jgi:hypothetical protein
MITLSSVITLILGLVIGYLLKLRAETKTDKRQYITKIMIKNYKILSLASKKTINQSIYNELRLLTCEIQLFGTIEQIKIAKKLAHDLGTKKVISYDPMLFSLRNSLRKQLSLPKTDERISYFTNSNYPF